VVSQHGAYGNPRFSPDGRRIAVQIEDDAGNDIWIIDPERGTRTRLTSDPANDRAAFWTRDGTRIVFSSGRIGAQTLYWVPTDGSGKAEPLVQSTRNQGATSWSPDGRILAFYEAGGESGYDVWTMVSGEKPMPFLATRFRERGAAFSPDGRWLAYSSNESGKDEVYVTPYPGPGGRITISTSGGRSPLWSANGRELFYRNGRQMMAVAVQTAPAFRAATPQLLFEGEFMEELENSGATNYDVSADGQQFLMMRPVASATTAEAPRPTINIVLNWFEELKTRVPAIQ
jgi:Tol biopolymer transport system component